MYICIFLASYIVSVEYSICFYILRGCPEYFKKAEKHLIHSPLKFCMKAKVDLGI